MTPGEGEGRGVTGPSLKIDPKHEIASCEIAQKLSPKKTRTKHEIAQLLSFISKHEIAYVSDWSSNSLHSWLGVRQCNLFYT